MALKEKLLENKLLNEENQFKVAEAQSKLSYQLGYESDVDLSINYDYLYEPFVYEYANIQLKLDNGTSKNPVSDRKKVQDILNSVEVIKEALVNVAGVMETWTEAVMLASRMGGVDLMGTPSSRYKAINILSDEAKGFIDIKAVDEDITKLAWDIFDEDGFVERIFLNKLNKLSETQEMYITIPDVNKENLDFKMLSSEIFESAPIGDGEEKALTGGVTETYRKVDENGELEIIAKELKGNKVQDFYIIDKETISNSMQFKTEMNKISAGMIGASFPSSDTVVAFNNNILAEVTNHYIKPGKALKESEEERFQEDYKKWFLKKEIGKEFPIGEPRPKDQPQQEVVEEEAVVEEQVV